MKKKYLLLVIFLFVCFAKANYVDKTIKIGLEFNTKVLDIQVTHTYNVLVKNETKLTLTKGKTYKFKIINNQITCGESNLSKKLFLECVNKKAIINLNGKEYRQNIHLSIKEKKFFIVNELELEKYLRGVLNKEIYPSWPIEAIKAQAVLARTYAIIYKGRHKNKGYDLCDNVHCQVYGGVSLETDKTNKAVVDTQGEVLTFKGKIAKVFYHSCCGGHTESVGNIWGNKKDVPVYLKGRKCKFCKQSDKYRWRVTCSYKELEDKLIANGFNVSKIKKIEVLKRSSSYRVQKIKIKCKNELVLTGNEFRNILGNDNVLSNRYKLKCKRKKFKLLGAGWGHGVGLCQWGAKALAHKGKHYKKILSYYFPNTKVIPWK